MSILNRPSDGLFNVLIAFVRCLVAYGPMPSEKLINLCAPPSAVSGQERAKQTLLRWIELGFLANEADVIAIADEYSGSLTKKALTNQTLARALREVVFSDANNRRFWDAEKNRSADFTRAVSWMLAQDVYKFQPTNHSSVEKVELSQLDKKSAAFTNSTRWAGFKSWASFLGFGSSGRYPSGVFVIDPTTAIRDVLPGVFNGQPEMTHTTFISSLAKALPVLDGGSYRIKVEKKIEKAQWRSPRKTEVSSSLSRSLLRLHVSESIRLEDRADAEKVTLLGRDAVERIVSHVVFLKGK